MQSHDPPQRDADLELHAEKVRAPIGWGQQEVMMERAGPGRVKVSVFHLEKVVSFFGSARESGEVAHWRTLQCFLVLGFPAPRLSPKATL